MSTQILVNCTILGVDGVAFAGNSYDSVAQADVITRIQAAGGLLETSTAALATAAALCQAQRAKGNSDVATLNAIMAGAIAAETPDLANVGAGKGASLVAVQDAGNFTAQTTVEGALAELYQDAKTVHKMLNLPLMSALDIATGALLAVFANATGTTPGTQFANSKAASIRWNNDAAPGAFSVCVPAPKDIDVTQNATFHALVSKSGATLADATKLTVAAFEQIPGALHDADVDFGGDTSAITGDLVAKTVSEVTLALVAANLHGGPNAWTINIKPKAGTLGTDDLFIHAAWIEYARLPMTS